MLEGGAFGRSTAFSLVMKSFWWTLLARFASYSYVSLANLIPHRRVEWLTGSYIKAARCAAGAHRLQGPPFIRIES